jgi:hypothetical protein
VFLNNGHEMNANGGGDCPSVRPQVSSPEALNEFRSNVVLATGWMIGGSSPGKG